jgi:hypothetical protein
MSLTKKVGVACLGLAAGGMCINPSLAQQGDSAGAQNLRGVKAVSNSKTPDKVVTLAPDGSFRAAVMTLNGFLVPGAKLTVSGRQMESSDSMKTITGTRGLTMISGLKPGLYKVRVESPHGTYDGSLLIKSSSVTNVSFTPPPLVTFLLVPAQPPDQGEDQDRRGALFLEDLEGEGFGGAGGGALYPVLGLAGGAAAIALPLSLGRSHRASP